MKSSVVIRFVILGLLWLGLVCTAMIPNEALTENFKKSADSYNNVAPYHFYNGEKWNGIADNYADIILLNVAWWPPLIPVITMVGRMG